MKKKIKIKITEIRKIDPVTSLKSPLFTSQVAAGFPSPADDFIDRNLDLNEYLIQHPAATFYVRVEGDSMINAGIRSGDVLIVDRALEPTDKKIVIAVVDGELTVKRIRLIDGKIYLVPENRNYKEIEIDQERDFRVWGVVTFVLHQL